VVVDYGLLRLREVGGAARVEEDGVAAELPGRFPEGVVKRMMELAA